MAQERRTGDVKLAEMAKDISYIKESVRDIKADMEAQYVAKSEFDVLRTRVDLLWKVVIGFVGLILIAFAGVVISRVIPQ